MRRRLQAASRADDVAVEIEIAVECSRRRNLRRPVDPPDRRRPATLRIVETIAKRIFELMPAVRRVQRFPIEAFTVQRRADDDGVQAAVPRDEIRAERLVAVPDTEIGLDS